MIEEEESKDVENLQEDVNNDEIIEEEEDSTLKVYKWVESIYNEFWLEYSQEQEEVEEVEEDFEKSERFPIPDIKTIQSFVEWLENKKKYSFKTVEDVVLPGLKFCHHQRNVKFERACKNEFKTQLTKWKKTWKGEVKENNSKNPVMFEDLKEIITNTPDEIFSKEAETSLFLFAFYTGSRSITCENVLLKDICEIHRLESNGNVVVEINLRVTKGNYNWNHIVTLEENKDDRSMDFVYWLFRHLEKNHNIEKFEQLTEEALEEAGISGLKLWSENRKQMETLFKRRSVKAGFPKGLLSFHSLRAGFMSQSILVNNGNSSALEKTALIGGWVPNGEAELKYISETTKKLMIATRLFEQSEPFIITEQQHLEQNNNNNKNNNNNQTAFIERNQTVPVIEEELGENSVLFHNLKEEVVSKWKGMDEKEIEWRYRPEKKIEKERIKKESERNYWSKEEVAILLKEKELNSEIKWVTIAEILKEQGFKPRNGRDVQSKWKSLNYNKVGLYESNK